MLHLVKLAVGVRDFDELSALVEARGRAGASYPILTRNHPRRSGEVLAGGSLYRVVAGSIVARQRILDIAEDARPDGSRCARIELAPDLVRVVPRPMKPFQGWRYLEAAAAPADLPPPGAATGLEALPAALRRELEQLCLI